MHQCNYCILKKGMLSGPVFVEVLRTLMDQDVPFRFTATGYSMTPFIRHGDMVTMEPIRGRGMRVGDVVACVPSDAKRGRLFIHRIVAEQNGSAVLRGDNCHIPDGPVPLGDIVGRITCVKRQGRKVFSALGRSGRLVAWLSFKGWLLPIKTVLSAPRRSAGILLRYLHGFRAVRAVSKCLCPPYAIVEADPGDMICVRAWSQKGLESSRLKKNPNATDYVARHGDKVLGFVQLVRRNTEGIPNQGYWLHSLMVPTRYRALGLGRALTRHVIEQARRENALEIFLNVFADNAPAVALYRKMGFTALRDPSPDKKSKTNTQSDQRHMMILRKPLQ